MIIIVLFSNFTFASKNNTSNKYKTKSYTEIKNNYGLKNAKVISARSNLGLYVNLKKSSNKKIQANYIDVHNVPVTGATRIIEGFDPSFNDYYYIEQYKRNTVDVVKSILVSIYSVSCGTISNILTIGGAVTSNISKTTVIRLDTIQHGRELKRYGEIYNGSYWERMTEFSAQEFYPELRVNTYDSNNKLVKQITYISFPNNHNLGKTYVYMPEKPMTIKYSADYYNIDNIYKLTYNTYYGNFQYLDSPATKYKYNTDFWNTYFN